jgi:hypothetical protein
MIRPAVARAMVKGIDKVRNHRLDTKDAFFFNWALQIPLRSRFRSAHARGDARAADPSRSSASRTGGGSAPRVLRHRRGQREGRGRAAIEQFGPFDIDGDADIMRALDKLLQAFVEQHRMKLPAAPPYVPCYRVRTA